MPPVNADRTALVHALRNLVSNAATHGGRGEPIHVRARNLGDAVEIEVSDGGPGIEPAEINRIFDPFYRGRRARETQTRGLGLGLSLVKRIIEAHGGSIAAANNPGKGACFMVGGSKEGFRIAEPILTALAADGACFYTGDPGSGHFVKLVQDGVEAGMLQAIGEGVSLLRGSDFHLDLEKVFKSWASGATVRGWLVELMAKSLAEQRFSDVPSHVEDTGEVNWLVHDAIEKEIPIPVIAQAVMELFRSRDKSCDASRSVALMRNSRGGYPLGKDDQVARERRTSRTEKI